MAGSSRDGDELTLNNGMHDQIRMTPSFIDTNSAAFSALEHQLPTYYTSSTPVGAGVAGPSQPANLRTPNMPQGLLTPLSLSQRLANEGDEAGVMPPSAMSMDLSPYNLELETLMPGLNAFEQANIFAPAALFNRKPDMNFFDSGIPEPQASLTGLDQFHNSALASMADHQPTDRSDDLYERSNEKFRFRAALRAPTAMAKLEDIPVSYLNKGQVYNVTVKDANPLEAGSKPLRYRTYIRISFEDEEQRLKPGSCWQLWKEGRGANEAHHRNGKLLAVEHVDQNQGGDGEPSRNTQVHLERACFDGFAVTWTPNMMNGAPECSIPVRFNFLSTDFSHSKGVKGIPVRLCAKTEALDTANSGPSAEGSGSEVCYCKVKLFRDHGAERKLSNDAAHVKKTIEKFQQQLSQAELGSANMDRRKSLPGKGAKVAKHKRTWSVGESGKPSLEHDLHMRIDGLHSMLNSGRSISLLNLQGDTEDDPDVFPVQFDPSDDSRSHGLRPLWELVDPYGVGT